jgi:hypothetical protein
MAYTPGVNGGRINLNYYNSTGGNGVLISTGTVYLSGGNNVTLSQNANTINVLGAGPILSRYEYPQQIFAPLTTPVQGSLSVEHEYIPLGVAASAMKIGGSLSVGSTSNGSMHTASVSLWMGAYTMNASTLSLAFSGSANNTFQHYGGSVAATVASNSSVTGMRQLTVPILTGAGTQTSVTIPAGEYWIGALISSSAATTNQSFQFTMYGNNQINGVAGSAVISPLGSATSVGRDVILQQGIYSAATNAMPATIGSADVNNSNASFVQWANFYNAIYNADY